MQILPGLIAALFPPDNTAGAIVRTALEAAEMGNLLEEEEPFVLPDKKGGTGKARRVAPIKDDKLYDL